MTKICVCDFVVATAAGVGMHVLAIRGNDRDHDQHHAPGGVPSQMQVGRACQREDQQDLLRRVSHRGQRVAGEDRKCDELREKRLAELFVAKRPTDDKALD